MSKSSPGFTLIELAVVLAVVAMVLVLVMPRLPLSERENVKISARTLASTLRYVQERAAATQTPYLIRLEPGSERVALRESTADGGEKEPDDPLLGRQPLKGGVTIADVMVPRLGKVSDGQVRLDIGPTGLRDFVVIHLRSPADSFWTVMAFPSSGKVKVFEGYREEAL